MSGLDASRVFTAERALLVLGCPVFDDESPRPPLARRLERTLALHHRFPEARVVLSGGSVRGPAEGPAMAKWLRARGVAPSAIRVEDQS
ncbi:MAG: YdcF family protein, partial [Myxococcota bacterium]